MAFLDSSQEFEFLEGLASELSAKELIFPTSLTVTLKIRHALHDENASAEHVARIVGAEPVLCAQILRIANSAAYNRGYNPTTDLHRAIDRLGFHVVRNMAFAVGMKQLVQTKSTEQTTKLINGLWDRSIRVAAMSFVMAKKLTRIAPDMAMVAGLLHDIGKFYILSRIQQFKGAIQDQEALWDLVDRWHVNIGEAILENWEAPIEVRQAVLNYRDTMRLHEGPVDVCDVVQAADILDAHRDPQRQPGIDWMIPPTGLVRLSLDQQSSETLLEEAKEEVNLIFAALA